MGDPHPGGPHPHFFAATRNFLWGRYGWLFFTWNYCLPMGPGRFLGILTERQAGRKCLKTARKKTAMRFFYLYKTNFDLQPGTVCNKIVKVKLLRDKW
jgi:hypothetical protein